MATDEDGIDRDTWCTPKPIADALGPVALDPCSNPRSHIRARRTFSLEQGNDGLALASFVHRSTRTHINPPYSHGKVIQWVRAYRHTRFHFLVRFDVSTEWWSELWLAASAVLTFRERIMFEPPPGVEEPPGSPFPHALVYSDVRDVTPEIRALCYVLVKEPGERRPLTVAAGR